MLDFLERGINIGPNSMSGISPYAFKEVKDLYLYLRTKAPEVAGMSREDLVNLI